MMNKKSDVDNFFFPESVAIFGVSETTSNLAGVIVENLERFHFKGRIYPIGSRSGHRGARKIHSSLEEIDEVPDLAVILVPAAHVAHALRACGKKGIGHVIVESGGFSELSDANKTLEDEVLRIASEFGIRVVGPNCFGVLNAENGLVLPFFILKPGYVRAGTTSLISQSGGLFYDTCMLCSCENHGLNKLISVGNKLMLDENTFLEYLINDPGTHVIGMYLEHFSDGKRLMDLASTTDKPIILLKANRTLAGREIAQFHTAALAGDDDVADAAMKQAGIHRVQNFQEMVDCFKIFSLPIIKGPRLAVISRSGGHGVLAADAAYRHGFTLARLSNTFFKRVREKKINVIRTTNPLDVGDVYNLDFYTEIMEMALREPGVDGIVFIVTFSSESDGVRMLNFIEHAARVVPAHQKPVVICMVSNREQWPVIREAARFPIFSDVDHALQLLAQSLKHHKQQGKGPPVRKPVSAPRQKTLSGFPCIPVTMRPDEVFALLGKYHIPVADYAIVKNIREGLRAVSHIGFPAVLKTGSPSVMHKTEAGGVKLNIANTGELKDAFRSMKADEYILQKMCPPGLEVIIGGRLDKEFGRVLLFGLGGILVETIKDRSIRVLPVNRKTARGMIEEIKGYEILRGLRGSLPVDIKALISLLVNTSRLLMEHPEITNIDMNPAIVFEEGNGCVIVDAKMQKR